jgi:hypothetical protein
MSAETNCPVLGAVCRNSSVICCVVFCPNPIRYWVLHDVILAEVNLNWSKPEVRIHKTVEGEGEEEEEGEVEEGGGEEDEDEDDEEGGGEEDEDEEGGGEKTKKEEEKKKTMKMKK